jgi:hypothetical protein
VSNQYKKSATTSALLKEEGHAVDLKMRQAGASSQVLAKQNPSNVLQAETPQHYNQSQRRESQGTPSTLAGGMMNSSQVMKESASRR